MRSKPSIDFGQAKKAMDAFDRYMEVDRQQRGLLPSQASSYSAGDDPVVEQALDVRADLLDRIRWELDRIGVAPGEVEIWQDPGGITWRVRVIRPGEEWAFGAYMDELIKRLEKVHTGVGLDGLWENLSAAGKSNRFAINGIGRLL